MIPEEGLERKDTNINNRMLSAENKSINESYRRSRCCQVYNRILTIIPEIKRGYEHYKDIRMVNRQTMMELIPKIRCFNEYII
jgi:hypothetical protein